MIPILTAALGAIPRWLLAAAIAALLALAGWQHLQVSGLQLDLARLQAAIAEQRAQASATLAAEKERTRKAEQALQTALNAQNIKDSDHAKTVSDLSARLRTLAGPAGRLRDPHAAQCGPSGSGPTAQAAPATAGGAADPAEAGGLLSAELGGLLQRLTAEADIINTAYASCRTDAYTVREVSEP